MVAERRRGKAVSFVPAREIVYRIVLRARIEADGEGKRALFAPLRGNENLPDGGIVSRLRKQLFRIPRFIVGNIVPARKHVSVVTGRGKLDRRSVRESARRLPFERSVARVEEDLHPVVLR